MFPRYIIQRYMPKQKFIKMIEDEGLYFRRIDGYEKTDPTEGDRQAFGTREQKLLDSMNSQYPTSPQMSEADARALLEKIMHRDKRSTFIQSWYWNEIPSDDMWYDYAQFETSADCVMFTCNLILLGNVMDRLLPVGLRNKDIEYIDDKQKTREAVFTKRRDFDIEKEYRISIDVNELITFNKKILPEFNWIRRDIEVLTDFDAGKNYRNGGIADSQIFKFVDEYGFILKLPLHILIDAIYVPTQSSSKHHKEMDSLLLSNGFDLKVVPLHVTPREGTTKASPPSIMG